MLHPKIISIVGKLRDHTDNLSHQL